MARRQASLSRSIPQNLMPLETNFVVDEDELAEVEVLELHPEKVAIVELLLSVVFVSVVLLLTTMEV